MTRFVLILMALAAILVVAAHPTVQASPIHRTFTALHKCNSHSKKHKCPTVVVPTATDVVPTATSPAATVGPKKTVAVPTEVPPTLTPTPEPTATYYPVTPKPCSNQWAPPLGCATP